MTLILLVLFFVGPDMSHIKSAMTAYQQGKSALLQKQPALAAEQFKKAIEVEPTFVDAYKGLIETRLAFGDRLETASVITRLLEIEPGASHYRLLLAQILLSEKQWDRSLAQFSFLLKADPFNADALLGFAAAAKSLGMEGRASEALAKGRDHYPADKRFRAP